MIRLTRLVSRRTVPMGGRDVWVVDEGSFTIGSGAAYVSRDGDEDLGGRDDRVHGLVTAAQLEHPRLETARVEARCFRRSPADEKLAGTRR